MVPSVTPAACAMARVVARLYPTSRTTSRVAAINRSRVTLPRSLIARLSVRSGTVVTVRSG
ncbi:hypothetical protein CTE05_13040 [Cellulomonas terrae]|uniref:Uncharacterized protein n=1 Tax=Cellulomonas terrae TaxID=311234 RepID=A0A511JIC5_9CELL|nr:hypothetical protein CTE05_13040 [Cellulomonas terrae]